MRVRERLQIMRCSQTTAPTLYGSCCFKAGYPFLQHRLDQICSTTLCQALLQALDVRKISVWCAAIGFAIPIAWIGLYLQSSTFVSWVYNSPQWVGNVRMVVWPSALLLVADPEETNVPLWIVSIILNGLLYFLIGSIIEAAVNSRKGESRV